MTLNQILERVSALVKEGHGESIGVIQGLSRLHAIDKIEPIQSYMPTLVERNPNHYTAETVIQEVTVFKF